MNINDSMPALRRAIDRTGPFLLAMDPEDAVALFFLLHQVQLKLIDSDLSGCEKLILGRAKTNLKHILKSHDYLFGALDPLTDEWIHIGDHPEYIRIMATIAAKQPKLHIKPTWDDYRVALLAHALERLETWADEQTGEEPFDPPSLDRLLAEGMTLLESQGDEWARRQLQWFAELQERAAETHWENLLTEHSNRNA